MAINPNTQYPGKTAGISTNYPFGQARNVTTSGDGTGTPWEAALVNDLFGMQQRLLGVLGLTPTGTPDNAVSSQYVDAMWTLLAGTRTLTHNMTTDADYTIGTTDAKEVLYGRYVITDTGVVLTTGRNIIVDTVERDIVVVNSTAQTLTVKTSAGTGIAVLAGVTASLRCDGTNVVSGDYIISVDTSNFDLITYRGEFLHDVTADADYTVTGVNNLYQRLKITDTGVVLTTGRNIIVDVTDRRFIFENATLQTLTVKTSAGTGVAVPAGGVVALRADGTNVVVGENGLGYNQLYADYTGSRSSGVSYQNTDGKPIFIYIGYDSTVANGNAAQVSPDNVTWYTVGSTSNVASEGNGFIVPDGYYYKSNTANFTVWTELR